MNHPWTNTLDSSGLRNSYESPLATTSMHGILMLTSALTQVALSHDARGAAAKRLTLAKKAGTMRLIILTRSTMLSLSVVIVVTVTQSASKSWTRIATTEAAKRAEVGLPVQVTVIGNTGGIVLTAGHQMREAVRRLAKVSAGLGTVRGAGLRGVMLMGNSLMEKGADGTGILHSPPMTLMARSAGIGAGSE